MRGDTLDERAVFAELALSRNNPVDSLEQAGWKLVRQRATGRSLLFDTVSDPSEQQDVAAGHADVVARLRQQLDAKVEEARRRAEEFSTAAPLELSPDELQRLRALGYLDGGP